MHKTFFPNWTAGESYALIPSNVLHYFKILLQRGILLFCMLWTGLGMLQGCGQLRVGRPSEALLTGAETQKVTCVLPFQNPSSHTVDRTLDFLACFSTQPDILRIHKILSQWRERLGKDQLDVFLSPIEALVTDPAFFRYVLTLMKDPDFPSRIAPYVRAFDTFLHSSLGPWGITLLQNSAREFSSEFQSFLSRDLRDPRLRVLWVSSVYRLLVAAALSLETYRQPPSDHVATWERLKRPFWSNLLGEIFNPAVRDWIWRKHRTFIDYFWTQAPEYRVMDLLLGNYPNSLIQSFSENVWLLKQAGRSGDIEQQHFTDYVEVHMNVMFDPMWPIDEIKLILSRSSPITFQLFQVNTPDYAEVEYSRWLNRNLLVLESAGALYQFVQLVQILFDLNQDVFWDVMGWMCREPDEEACSFFQSASYLWSHTPIAHAMRHMPQVPEFAKQKAIAWERDSDLKRRVIGVFPEIPDSDAWLDAVLDLAARMETVLLKWAPLLAEGRGQGAQGQPFVPKSDQVFLTQADQFIAHLANMDRLQELPETWQVILDQPEFVALLSHSASFLVSASAPDILSRTAILGERFLAGISPWVAEDQAPFVLQDRGPVSRKPLMDWYEIVPITPAQEWEIGIIRDSIEHPSATVSPEWSQMGGINTLYYMFMPDYLVRENFDALYALRWISSLAEVFDFPKTLQVIPPTSYDAVIPSSVDFGPDFVGPYRDNPLKRLLWRLQQTRLSPQPTGGSREETLAEVLIRRLQERLATVPNLDVLLMRLASERSFMLLHPDREVKAMQEMIALVESRTTCRGKEVRAEVCRIPHELRTYVERWEQEKTTMQPYALKVERAGWDEPSIFEEMERIMELSSHPFVIDLDQTRSIDAFLPVIPGALPKTVLSPEGERLSILMRMLGVSGLYYDDMAMHFFINLVHNSDGRWPRIHELVNRVFFDEFTGSGKLTLDNYVDSKPQFRSAVFEGIAFPSGRVYCSQYHMCDFPTELSLLLTLSQFSTFRYMAEPLGNGESLFSIFFPFFQDVDTFTAPEYRLNHAWGKNHLGFFMDLGRVHGMRAVRPLILHLTETGELAHALELVRDYLSGYQTPEDFVYLNLILKLVDEKLPLFQRLLSQLPKGDGLNPVYAFDMVWVGIMAALERMEKVVPPRAPDVDQWVAAALSVLDEKMVDDLAAFARVIEPPLRSLMGSARFLRILGAEHEVLKILTKIFFNVAVTDAMKQPLTLAQRQQAIRDTIAQLPEWTQLAKEHISKYSWDVVVHDDPVSDAQWIQHRAARLAKYLQGLFFPRGKKSS